MNNKKWIDHALSCGFESFEIYQETQRSRSVSWYQGQTDSSVSSRVTGTSLRGFINGRMVSYATEDTADAHMEEIVDSMKEQAGVIGAGETGTILSPAETAEAVSAHTYQAFSAEEVRTALKELEERITSYDSRMVPNRISYEEEGYERTICNSKGLNIRDAGMIQLIMAGAAASDHGDVKNDFRYEVVSSPEAFDAEAFAEKLCGEILKKLGAGSMKSTACPVILDREAMTALFGTFSDIFSGDQVSRGISPLAGKLNSRVFSEKITIIDDPREPAARNLYNYDDEGHPTYRKYVVRNGVLETILHSTESAARMQTESTGNGFKDGYASPVRAVPKNLFIESGDLSPEALMQYIGDGLVITDLAGLHAGLDHVTGDFSLQCAGYRVRDGKRAENVTLITIAGNFLTMMQDVLAVGNDPEWKAGTTACPSIAFRQLSVSGT